MKEWWMNLQSREQRLVAALGSVLLVFLCFQLIWQPLTEGVTKAQAKLARQQALLEWVTIETARIAQQPVSNASNNTTASISSIVNRTARQKNIVIARLQPQTNSVLVWVDNINFNTLLTWLANLSEQHGIKVINIDINQDSVSGSVEIKRLQLGR